MRCSKLDYINGQVVETDIKEIDQRTLTSDCWLIQINGLTACTKCEFKNTKNCGGGEVLKQIHLRLQQLKQNKSKSKKHESTKRNEDIGY